MTTDDLGPLALSRGTVDRRSDLRRDDDALREAWADPRTRVLVLHDGRAPVAGPDESPHLVFVPPSDAPPGERYLLGVDDERIGYFAVDADGPAAVDGTRQAGLRAVGALLGDRDAGLLTEAVALERWHQTHTHCPRCGTPTTVESAGHVTVCPADGSQHFPRVDPAVIMLVHDEAGDRCLLGHQPRGRPHGFSTLAGFVEPGEPIEAAVVREVAEEVGITVLATRYMGDQPWPLPASLMLGFFATARYAEPTYYDGEIGEARWFTRAQLRAATETGEILLPGHVSIARALIETWYGGPLSGHW